MTQVRVGALKVRHMPPEYDTLFYRVHTPLSDEQTPPYPVVLLLPAFGCGAASYSWLASRLAQRGLTAVTYEWVGQVGDGRVSLTPGVESAALDVVSYGTIPSAPAVAALLDELEKLNASGELAGVIDLNRLVLGGHGAGGWLALQNATRRFFLTINAAFAYAPVALDLLAHVGHEPGVLPVLPSEVPTLTLAGTDDGVGTRLQADFGDDEPLSGVGLIKRQWDKCIGGGHGHAYFMSVRGANHYTIAHPVDEAALWALHDHEVAAPGEEARSLIADIIGRFICGYVRRAHGDLDALRRYIAHRPPLLTEARLK
jgi:dienelactone hydrolase